MSEQDNVQVIKDIYAAFGRGDIPAILAALGEYVAQGDRVVALGRYRFRARATGTSFESPWAMAWTFRDGKPVDCRVFEDTETQASAIRGS